MNVGQLFGAGAPGAFGYQGGPKHVGLYCRVESIDAAGVHAYVINGDWYLLFSPSGTIMHGPRGDELIDARIVFTGTIPEKHRGDYNNALEWMNAAVHSWKPMWLQTMIYTVRHAITVRTARITNTWYAAVQAGKKEWNRTTGSIKCDEFLDEIPF